MSVLPQHDTIPPVPGAGRSSRTRQRAVAAMATIALVAGLVSAVSPLVRPVAATDPVAASAEPTAESSAVAPAPATPDPAPTAAPDPSPIADPTPSPDLAKLPRYPLRLPEERPTDAPTVILNGPSPFTTPHMASGMATDTCAACHRGHTAETAMLGVVAGPSSALCLSCHDGSGSQLDIAATYADPGLPANVAGTSSWYSHPATVDLGHLPGQANEFGGVEARHATCADCHQPHRADGSLAAPDAAGWRTSGANLGAQGVAVTNGAPGSVPVYTLTSDPQREYQLCLKCHSSFTDLPAQDPAHPSRWALDKGIELNPANGSTHPIEAAGSNATAAMAASLAGGTLWQFAVGDTIRCTNCHGDPAKALPGATTDAADRLAPHASVNRGILIAPYRDRLLTPAGQGYDGLDFTLCWLCHAESPFTGAPGGEAATNFPFHQLHVAGIDDKGSGGLDIDTTGAGQGNAICAECHFRLHSTALAVNPDDRDNERLVNFAPNVEAFGGVLEWAGGAGGGSCTLVCHGQDHDAEGY